ncbi:AAA family ATPase [Pseudomonas cedrina]|uniref:AAA family ATPase n=1 Tax=Pseudomonas cedrina TaxID=651740 RepID=UPI002782FB60|nr:AAA family ATPase [Pseudomonas cedrina]MDQ0653336.1 ABC-type cobalamin/Fe3+-siderophores transport system ATPase subunit [Pseudomonas cedrina]
MSLSIDLELKGTKLKVELRAGLSTIIVGANGSGKTKLAMECEKQLGEIAHRISAQRMLAFDPEIEKISEERARNQLRSGAATPVQYGDFQHTRKTGRWGREEPKFILNDAGALLQVLFAEQANTAVNAYNSTMDGEKSVTSETLVRKLKSIYHRVLPHRGLDITADNITVCPSKNEIRGEPYSITQMSDGEKAVFYMIGQILVASHGSVFIMDEPEIHVHRSILSRLWDELEAARPDCAFLLITHDLEFAASRAGNKYVVSSYEPIDGWVIEKVPEAEGFGEELITLILGSRKPILFVEGDSKGSLDIAFYRACYPGWTIVPRGGCEGVIHSVVTMQNNKSLTRVRCAGIVDADGRSEADRVNLEGKGIKVLPVSEIENLLLLPTVSRAILEIFDPNCEAPEKKLSDLKDAILADASDEKNINDVVMEYCRRRIDRILKQLDFAEEKSVEMLAASYSAKTAELDITKLANDIKIKIAHAVATGNLPALLAIYDRKKPLLALASSHLCHWKVDIFKSWITRTIQSPSDTRLREILLKILPEM